MILDRTIVPHNQGKAGIVLPPHYAVRYQTTEFNCIANTNSLGFRDREFTVVASRKVRIVAIGDSFTFGWGVGDTEAWPKVLESRLQEEGYDVEVLNLGKGGTCTTQYLQITRRAIPRLRPNIVIVGLLQEDDLAQKLEEQIHPPDTEEKNGMSLTLSNILPSMFTNTFRLLFRVDTIDVHERWKTDATLLVSGANRLAFIRYRVSVDKMVQRMVESGNLNPALLSYALYFPERTAIVNEVDNPIIRKAIQGMKDDVAEIAKLCAAYNSRLVILAMPIAAYKNADLASYSQMGFIGVEAAGGGFIQDSIYASIAQSVGAPFLALSDAVAVHPSRRSFYYRYDGHLTVSGHEFVGDTLAAFLDTNGLMHGAGKKQ